MKIFWYMILGYFRKEHFSDGKNSATLDMNSFAKEFRNVKYTQLRPLNGSVIQDDRYWRFVYLVSEYIKNKYRIKGNHPELVLDPLIYDNAGYKFKKIKKVKKWNWAGSYTE